VDAARQRVDVVPGEGLGVDRHDGEAFRLRLALDREPPVERAEVELPEDVRPIGDEPDARDPEAHSKEESYSKSPGAPNHG
jgi:hypothetical protein